MLQKDKFGALGPRKLSRGSLLITNQDGGGKVCGNLLVSHL